MKTAKKLLTLCLALFMIFSFAACSTPKEENLVITQDKTTVKPGEAVTLSAGDTTDAVYEITAGEDYATISGNVVTVNADAPDGAKIKVSAKAGTLTSNEITITVSNPLESIAVSAGGVTNVLCGNSVILKKTLTPANSTATVNWTIVEGGDYCAISGDVLVVNANAPTGAIVKVKAASGSIESEVLSFTVGYPLTSISASVIGSANIEAGNSAPLVANITPANATNASIEWVFVEGGQFATITNNVLTIKPDAPLGTFISFKAVSGSIESNVVPVTVGVPITSIAVTELDVTNVELGSSVPLFTTLTPANASSSSVEWKFIEGGDYATIVNNVLTVKSGAPIGATISFKAVSGSIESNVITIKAGFPITSIIIEAIGDTTVIKGNSVSMSETIAPSNASAQEIIWTIVEGADYATLTSKTLVIKSNAPTGATVKVKASAGSVESNVLTFTVGATQEEINATRYLMSFDENKLTLDKNGDRSPVLELNVYNYNFEPVENLTINYEIISGSEFLTITPNGYSCALSAKGHGTATVKATINGTTVSQTATVNVIVPPENISLPEVFRERPGFVYNFSMVDPKTSAPELLPFEAGVLGSLVCTDLKYSFTHKDGTKGDEVAVYEGGKITFKKTGEVTVTVSSNSGSRNEASVSYRFNINKGYNVSTFEELAELASDSSYTGSLPINIVVFEKPDGSVNNYEYGFDLVPATALKAKTKDGQPLLDVINYSKNTIKFSGKGVYLNGNNHKIDASQLRIPDSEEISTLNAQGNTWHSFSALMEIAPVFAGAQNTHGTYTVDIYDLKVVGNCPMSLNVNTTSPAGVYRIGIYVGTYNETYTADYYLNMDNVMSSAFTTGMRLVHVVEGNVKNVVLDNCFANGLEVGGSIITLENMVYGTCGAAGIELVPSDCDKAGIGRNQNQQVTYKGEVNVQFHNNFNTVYLKNYTAADYTIPQILQASFASSGLNDNQIAHIRGQDGAVIITFMFHDFSKGTVNTSQLIYPGFQSGGIINAKDLPTDGSVDTTHEYIELNVGIPGIDAGKAYFYNLNYQAK